jgi:hypothetical protein
MQVLVGSVFVVKLTAQVLMVFLVYPLTVEVLEVSLRIRLEALL